MKIIPIICIIKGGRLFSENFEIFQFLSLDLLKVIYFGCGKFQLNYLTKKRTRFIYFIYIV